MHCETCHPNLPLGFYPKWQEMITRHATGDLHSAFNFLSCVFRGEEKKICKIASGNCSNMLSFISSLIFF